MNVLVDTCVYIDFLGRKAPFYDDAEGLVAAGFFGDAKLWVASHSVLDAHYVLRKFCDRASLEKAIETSYQVFTPVDISGQDALRALRLGWDDFEDCIVALAAEKAKADYLVTRDPKGFARSSVPVVSPAEWLQMMREEQGLIYASEEL